MSLQGSCHCEEVTFEVDGTPDNAVECNCSHCSRKGYLLWFIPREQLRFTNPKGADALSSYKFHNHVIDHRFCPICGTAPLAFGKGPDGEETAAINLRCLEDFDLQSVAIISYDGRSL